VVLILRTATAIRARAPICVDVRTLRPRSARRVGDTVAFYKIGLELATSPHYFELLDWLLEQDKKVFTDLKLYDIPATVSAAVRQIGKSGASFLTVHGDRAIMEAAGLAKGDYLQILVVTVLTSIAPRPGEMDRVAGHIAGAREASHRGRMRRRDHVRARSESAARDARLGAADRHARHPARRFLAERGQGCPR
jgi:orotidine-5'-phosphate decarboxylase